MNDVTHFGGRDLPIGDITTKAYYSKMGDKGRWRGQKSHKKGWRHLWTALVSVPQESVQTSKYECSNELGETQNIIGF